MFNKNWLELLTVAAVDGDPYPPLLNDGQQASVKSSSIFWILCEDGLQHGLYGRDFQLIVRQALPPIGYDEVLLGVTPGNNLK